jgi:chaperonin GroES
MRQSLGVSWRRVLFGKYTSQEITLDGEEYLIMRDDEVLAVIETG